MASERSTLGLLSGQAYGENHVAVVTPDGNGMSDK